MKLIVATGSLLAVGILIIAAVAYGATPDWTGPSYGHISDGRASIYYSSDRSSPFVIYLPGDWSSASASTQNAAARSFTTDVTLTSPHLPSLSLEGDSARPSLIEINGSSYRLNEGAVFFYREDATVVQLAFAPLEPNRSYLQQLHKFTAEND